VYLLFARKRRKLSTREDGSPQAGNPLIKANEVNEEVNEEKGAGKRCEVCGMPFIQEKRHLKTVWHQEWPLIKRSLDAGIGALGIARILGVSKQYIHLRLRQMK
jgi:hypothetical protein